MSEQQPSDLFAPDADRAPYVQTMFSDIAARYDLMNSVMTGGRHHAWRKLAASLLVRPGDRVIDAGSGTGDLAFACVEAGAGEVLGLDFARPMLEHAGAKAARRGGRANAFALGDATHLPLPDESADVWCSAFVVRNIPQLDTALAEAFRVLKPGGRIGVLEIPRLDRGLLRPLIRLHFARLVPLLGRLISGHESAYEYLPVSVDHFLTPPEFSQALRRACFVVTDVRVMMLGTVALHVAEKPAD
ncbi:MAG TPA: ubiquinone/menaquinone biosynthesis methyltransferase [Dehalococcoidia bacterium]|nr:ubiquinone/menaquinone biosynthesis methyltransferase [Dehalococcoidia bacterium]